MTTLFQPIVHLETQSVVGFEALSRGPEGTTLKTPLALIEAARAVGRLGELDWLCRVRAVEVAASSGLAGSLSWFINVEPAGLEIPCPPHLLPALSRARTDLRIILEVVERDIEGHVTRLLHAADQARADAWGVALDDVGAEESSLALLPFLQPDVVKLDMTLVQGLPGPAAAAVTAAVRSYAENTGAAILAEGIETAAQERLARTYGATYGQGYRYGRPARLPAHVPPPRDVVPLRQRPTPLGDTTPFEVVTATVQPDRTTKEMLLHISRHLETQSADLGEPAVLLAGFQVARFFSESKRRRYDRLAKGNALTVVLAEGLRERVEPRMHVANLRRDSRMCREWVVIVLSPRCAAAFVARDCGDVGPDLERRFDFVFTHDRAVVVQAARSFMRELLPAAAAIPLPAGTDSAELRSQASSSTLHAQICRLSRFIQHGHERDESALARG